MSKQMICEAVDTKDTICGKPAVAIIKDMVFSGKGTEFPVCKECLKSFPTKGKKPLYKIISCVEVEPQPSQVQEKQCTAPWKKSNCLCEKTCPIVEDGSICKYYPQHTPTLREQMPLIEGKEGADELYNLIFLHGAEAQRDADMAWYNKRLEEIAKGLPDEYEARLEKPKAEFMNWYKQGTHDQKIADREAILKQREGI